MERTMVFTLTLTFDDGRLDRETVEANLHRCIKFGVSEGVITPDDDEHVTLVAWDLESQS